MPRLEALPAGVYLFLLGSAQDGGFPHIGCYCGHCERARLSPEEQRYVASAAVIDSRPMPATVYLLDVTPDIKQQVALLEGVLGAHPTRPRRLRQPNGVFLTHAHMGHVAGLPQLSMEAMFVQELTVYASAKLIALLQETALWQPLVAQLRFQPLTDQQPVQLATDLSITPYLVPHRDEWDTGTFGFMIEGPSRRLFYVPDIDSWVQWPEAHTVLASADVAVVDASFYRADELSGRDPIAHTLIPDTLDLWQTLSTQLVLTHLNHTNPILNPDSPEYQRVTATRATIARAGQWFDL